MQLCWGVATGREPGSKPRAWVPVCDSAELSGESIAITPPGLSQWFPTGSFMLKMYALMVLPGAWDKRGLEMAHRSITLHSETVFIVILRCSTLRFPWQSHKISAPSPKHNFSNIFSLLIGGYLWNRTHSNEFCRPGDMTPTQHIEDHENLQYQWKENETRAVKVSCARCWKVLQEIIRKPPIKCLSKVGFKPTSQYWQLACAGKTISVRKICLWFMQSFTL